jgi:hypothetical protein
MWLQKSRLLHSTVCLTYLVWTYGGIGFLGCSLPEIPGNICNLYFSKGNTFRFLPCVPSDLLSKGTVLSVHAMKAYGGSRSVLPLILNPVISLLSVELDTLFISLSSQPRNVLWSFELRNRVVWQALPSSCTLKLKAVCFSEASVPTYQTAPCHNAKEQNTALHRHEYIRFYDHGTV